MFTFAGMQARMGFVRYPRVDIKALPDWLPLFPVAKSQHSIPLDPRTLVRKWADPKVGLVKK